MCIETWATRAKRGQNVGNVGNTEGRFSCDFPITFSKREYEPLEEEVELPRESSPMSTARSSTLSACARASSSASRHSRMPFSITLSLRG